jgi:ubiquinone/menaquinone biosynthesis C-methylase UbiE
MGLDRSSPAAVFDRASDTYDDVGVEFFTTFGRRLVEHAGLAPGERVLDIGTGRGAVLFPAAEAVGPTGHVFGIDLAPGMVQRTAVDVVRRGLDHVAVREGDAADPPVPQGERFDAVLSSLVLFFLDEPAAALSRWASLLADGGRLGLVTFLADQDDTRFRDVLRRHMTTPDGGPPPDQGPSSFDLVRDPGWLDDAIRAAGLPAIMSTQLRHQVVVDDVDHLLRWAWSQGMRVALEHVPDERMPEVRRELAEDLDRHRLPDGRLGLHVTVRFTIARGCR